MTDDQFTRLLHVLEQIRKELEWMRLQWGKR